MSGLYCPDQTVDVPAHEAVLEAGLMAAFGVLASRPLLEWRWYKILSSVLQSVPHVHLRDPESGPGSPIVRRSGVNAAEGDPGKSAYQLFVGEAPAAAWGRF